MNVLFLLCFLGLIVCLYGWWVERRIAQNADYKAACDISDRASCSKVFKSPYAHLFGFSNVYKGMIFYTLVAFCTYLGYKAMAFWITLGALIVSVVLAYLLVVKIRTLCVICITVYALNAALFVASCYWYFMK